VVYATLRWQSVRFRCRSPASSPSTLHVSWARKSPCTEPRSQEPARSCFLLAFYAKLFQSSTRVWPVILTSVRSPAGTGRDAVGSQRRPYEPSSPCIYSKQTLWKLLSQPHLRLVRVVFYTWTLQFTTGHVRPFSIVSLSTTSLHGLMLVRDSKSRCTSDSTLTVTCYTDVSNLGYQDLSASSSRTQTHGTGFERIKHIQKNTHTPTHSLTHTHVHTYTHMQTWDGRF